MFFPSFQPHCLLKLGLFAAAFGLGLPLSADETGVDTQPKSESSDAAMQRAAGFADADTDKDGQVSQQEFQKFHARMFKRADRNADGKLDEQEFARIGRAKRAGDATPKKSPSAKSAPESKPPAAKTTETAPGFTSVAQPETGDGGVPKAPSPEERMKRREDAIATERESGAALIGRLDKNGNGTIEENEAPERIRMAFGTIDRNSDGSLDAEELKKLSEIRKARGKRGAQAKKQAN